MSARPIRPGSKEHYRRGCKRKRRYPDHVTALAFAIDKMQNGAPKLDTYHCRFCSGWHLCTAKSKSRKLFARKAP